MLASGTGLTHIGLDRGPAPVAVPGVVSPQVPRAARETVTGQIRHSAYRQFTGRTRSSGGTAATTDVACLSRQPRQGISVKLNRPSVFIAGAVTALTLGGGTAYAANGGSFLLGRSNTATTATTLTNTVGTPLSLKAKTATHRWRSAPPRR